MFTRCSPGNRQVTDDPSQDVPTPSAGAGAGRVLVHAGTCLAVMLALLFAPAAAHADPPHGHPAGRHFAVQRAPHESRHFGQHAPAAPARRWAGHAPDFAWHAGADRGGDRGAPRWHGPGDVQRWHGGDGRDWHGRDGHRGAWDGGRWQSGWRGGDWDRRHWRGALWVGGYWGGYYWPPVDYGWSYPWYLATVPFGAMTITFGGVPYYYVNHVYYAWNPYYDGYVVTNPPPVAEPAPAPAGAPPAAIPDAGAGGGVLGLRVTPLKGQDAQQSANDRYACNTWAVAQSGFDPLNAHQDAQATPAVRDDYRRAFTACLQARGYGVH